MSAIVKVDGEFLIVPNMQVIQNLINGHVKDPKSYAKENGMQFEYDRRFGYLDLDNGKPKFVGILKESFNYLFD